MIQILKDNMALYAGMTDAEVADYLNAENVVYERDSLLTGEIYNCVNPAEFVALSADNRQLLRDILSLGQVDVSEGTNARAVLMALFPAGTATLDNLAAKVTVTTTKAKQLGINIPVMDYHVTEARA